MRKPGPLTIPPQSIDIDDQAIGVLFEQVRSLVQKARRRAVTTVNSLQVITNFEIGRMIIEHEQQGIHRAEYGKMVLKALSERLTVEFGRGFSEDNLSNMRKFYLVYKVRLAGISEKPSRKSTKAETRLNLSWSHYVFLCRIGNEKERRFYEIEASENNWSLPELKRQFDAAPCIETG
jgi:DUF1016 N-terminal domain